MEFLTNTENAQRVNGLVEDIRISLMDYQVCKSNYSILLCLMFMPDFIATRYIQRELWAHCESRPPLPFVFTNQPMDRNRRILFFLKECITLQMPVTSVGTGRGV